MSAAAYGLAVVWTLNDINVSYTGVWSSLADLIQPDLVDAGFLYIAHDDRLMRRVRFTLNGLDATKGAVAEVDAGYHALLHGVNWPTLFHERLIRPVPTPVHDWRLTGLDVDRGLTAAEVGGMALEGRALFPAAMVG